MATMVMRMWPPTARASAPRPWTADVARRRRTDHAKMFRVQIMAIHNKSRTFQRMKLTPMITFSAVDPVMSPTKKFKTGETGIPSRRRCCC